MLDLRGADGVYARAAREYLGLFMQSSVFFLFMFVFEWCLCVSSDSWARWLFLMGYRVIRMSWGICGPDNSPSEFRDSLRCTRAFISSGCVPLTRQRHTCKFPNIVKSRVITARAWAIKMCCVHCSDGKTAVDCVGSYQIQFWGSDFHFQFSSQLFSCSQSLYWEIDWTSD